MTRAGERNARRVWLFARNLCDPGSMLTHVRSLVGLPLLALTARSAHEQCVLGDDVTAVQTAKSAFDWMPAYMVLDAALLLVMDDTSWSYRGPVLLHHLAVTAALFAVPPRSTDSKTLDRRWLVYNTVEMSAQLLTFQYYAERWRLPGHFWVSAAVFAVYVAARIVRPLQELRRGVAEDEHFWTYGETKGTATTRMVNGVEFGLFLLNVVWSWKGGQRLLRAASSAHETGTYDSV